MTLADWIIITLSAAVVAGAVVRLIVRRKQGKSGCGGCAGCSRGDCPSRRKKPEDGGS